MAEKREFKGIWIPKHIWLNKELSISEIFILAEIESYDNDFGCTATNRTLCEDLRIQPSTVSGLIKTLEEKGFIKVEYKNLNSFEGRKITMVDLPLRISEAPFENPKPPSEKSIHSNIFSNTFSKKNIKDILLSEIKISDFVEESRFIKYFEITTAFVEVFKKNKISLGDENLNDLNNAKFKSYVDPIRLLITNDKYTIEDLKKVYSWLDGPDSFFWKPNVLCTSKLREKFSKLLIEAKKVSTKKVDEPSQVYTPAPSIRIDHSNRT